MTNTTLTAQQIKANIEGIEMTMNTIIPNEANAATIAMLQQQLAEYKTVLRQAIATTAVDESSAAGININNTNTKGEKNTMANTVTTTNNTNIEGAKTMTNATTTTKQNNVIKGENKMKNVLVLNKAQLIKIEKDTEFMQKYFKGYVKTLSQIIGSLKDVLCMAINSNKGEFVIKENTGLRPIPFGKTKGQELISLFAEFLPRALSKEELEDNKAYKRLKDLNLLNFKSVNYVSPIAKKRNVAVVFNFVCQDTDVLVDNKKVGSFAELAKEGSFNELVFDKNGEVKANVRFVAAKDLRLNHMNSVHTAYQKQNMNLSFNKLVRQKGVEKQEIGIQTKCFAGPLTYTINKPLSCYVFDDISFVDGNISTALDEELESKLLAYMFNNIEFVHRENGELQVGEIVEPSAVINLRAYIRSMAQARTKGAIAFKSLDNAAEFLIATGQLDKAYGKKDENSDDNVLDVDGAYKRLFLGGSSGQLATKGILSPAFISQCKIEYYNPGELHTFGEIKPGYIVCTHPSGETFTMAFVQDFTTTITRGENGENDFLINVLDKEQALLRLEEFSYWEYKGVKDILRIVLTDGNGYHNARVTESARTSGILNSFSTFQMRKGFADKGASIQADFITDYLKADMVLTKSMVKATFDMKAIADEIKEHGFLFYVVGQRKDSEDGLFVASQATQTYGLTESELIALHKESIAFVKKAMDTRNAAELMEVLNVADKAQEDEFATFDFLRIAQQVPAVLNEQYFKDDVAALIVKRMNQLLDSRVYAKKARPRYMFTEPMAIFNAIKRGSYEVIEEDKVLGHNEVIAPSVVNGKYELEVGEAAGTRFPCSVVHESAVVTAVYNEEYARMAEEYGWGGVVFFDAKSWVVQRMAGADFDGDACILIFDAPFVAALKRTQSQLFAGLRVLPCIDAYVVEGGVKFGTGCPTYVTEANKGKKEVETKTVNEFIKTVGNKVFYNPSFLTGENEDANRFELAKVVASIANVKTIHSVESSLIGIIANQIMILTDLLTRDVLTNEERLEVETELLLLRSKGAWELDRPKHGGAYLEMPIFVKQDARLNPLRFTEEELFMSDDKKKAKLAEQKGALRYAFDKEYKTIDGVKVLSGFSMKKPSWLASQKAEFGLYNEDSTFQKAFDFVSGTKNTEGALQALCHELALENKGANNNILGLVRGQMKVDGSAITAMTSVLAPIYNEYAKLELERSRNEKAFKTNAHLAMKEDGAYARKNFDEITSAVKNSKLRTVAEYVTELDKFKAQKEVLKAVLRKDVYEVAASNGWDVRYLVGALYMLIKSSITSNKAAYVPYRMDGREVRFVGAGSGNISVCFEVFGEEMKSLLLDDVEATSFIPTNTDFVLVEDASLLPQHTVKVKIMNPNAKHIGALKAVNAMKPISITEQDGKPVINFYKNGVLAMKGWSPVEVPFGYYNVLVETIQFSADNAGIATITFRA